MRKTKGATLIRIVRRGLRRRAGQKGIQRGVNFLRGRVMEARSRRQQLKLCYMPEFRPPQIAVRGGSVKVKMIEV